MALLDQQCANRVATGAAVGGALGASIGTPPILSSCTRSLIDRYDDRAYDVYMSLNMCVFCSGDAGALYGTYEAFRYKVPGLYKIRYIGQTTVSSAAVFGLFLGAGSLLHCGRHS